MVRMAPNLHYAKANGKCCGGDPARRRHPPAPRRVAEQRRGRRGRGQRPRRASIRSWPRARRRRSTQLPTGYGYPVGATDHWVLNYMIHNLTAEGRARSTSPTTWTSSPTARRRPRQITPVHPIWMDVEDHNIYPVFNVYRHSGRNGKFTFPDMAKNPYHGRPAAERVHGRPPGDARRPPPATCIPAGSTTTST